ncbi:MAG: hypothetical protein AB1411_15985 [Nitrospirota bacterium]
MAEPPKPTISYQIAYRNHDNRLNGCAVPNLDPIRRAQATDKWVRLPNQERIRPSWIVSIALCENDRPIRAWLVKQYGLDDTIAVSDKTPPPAFSWLREWSRVAEMVQDIPSSDPRFPAVLKRLDDLDLAYQAGHPSRFLAVRDRLSHDLQSA